MTKKQPISILPEIVKLFKTEHWQVKRDLNQVVDPEAFSSSIKRLNIWASASEIKEAYLKLTIFPHGKGLRQINEQMFEALREGMKINSGRIIKLIDWQHPDHNTFILAENLTIINNFGRTTYQLVGFINGLPMIIIQEKQTEGFYQNLSNQLTSASPELFYYNPILIFTNQHQTRIGSTYSEWVNFSQWMNLENSKDSPEWRIVAKQVANTEFLVAIIQSFLLNKIFGVMESQSYYLNQPSGWFLINQLLVRRFH